MLSMVAFNWQPATAAMLDDLPKSTNNLTALREAIDLANTLLLKTNVGQLYLEGTSRPREKTAQAIPVRLVDGGTNFIIAVPRDTRLIVVGDSSITNVPTVFTRSFTNGLAIDTNALLALCLLHESGHLRFEHHKKALGGTHSYHLNIEQTASKKAEEEADTFAAQVMKTAFASTGDIAATISSGRLQMAASSISWNLQGWRSINNFGATALRRAYVLADTGFSHPNIELRFLRINHLLNPTAASEKLLRDFDKFRDEIPKQPEVLYQP